MADRELEILRDALREHVNALAVDIGPRTPLNGDSLIRAAIYIRSVFEATGLLVTEQDYQYLGACVIWPAPHGYPLTPLPDLTAEGTAEKYNTGDQALEKAGCEFICEDDVSGPGVRLRKKQVRIGG